MLNYEYLTYKSPNILENQRISKKKEDQILEIIQKGFIGFALRNKKLLKSDD